MTMNDIAPEHTAVRVSLWRALHAQIDAKPHVLVDEVGEKLVAEESWRERPDMKPQDTRRIRASIVGRSRFIEDLVEDQLARGVKQYVILGAGLDSFAQRRVNIASRMNVFEVDQPGPQAWKQQRLKETGFGIPDWLRFVPVDFEARESWQEKLNSAGFDKTKPAIVASAGVSMYLTKEANLMTLQKMAQLTPGSCFVTSFMLPMELLEPEDQPTLEFTMKKTREAGTPFISFFTPDEMLELARKAGFKKEEYFSIEDMRQRYFSGREDALVPGSGQGFLIAMT